jgi:hypothetical protein
MMQIAVIRQIELLAMLALPLRRTLPRPTRSRRSACTGALLIGPRHSIAAYAEDWSRTLSTFEIDLKRDGTVVDYGRATNVLDGPVSALRHLVDILSRARSGQSATRSRRDRHDGNADACTSGISRRNMDNPTHGCWA